MKSFILILIALTSAHLMAADLNGSFQCDDGGTLSLKSYGIRHYLASLEYPDGSASTLAEIEFPGESLRGYMYRDDEERDLGRVIEGNSGKRLTLRFNGGTVVLCTRD